MAVYGKHLHFIKDDNVYNLEMVTTLAEATLFNLNTIDEDKVLYSAMVDPTHQLATPLRVAYGATVYAVPTRNVIPYNAVFYTKAGSYTFTTPIRITRIRCTIVGGGGGGYASWSSGGASSGASSVIRGFSVWQIVGGGGGASVSAYTSGEGEHRTTSYSSNSGSGGSGGGRSGSYSAGGAGWDIGDGSGILYGAGGNPSHSSRTYNDEWWGRPYTVYTYGGGGGSGGCKTFDLTVRSGQVFNITVGSGGGNGTRGAAKIEYGEGIEPV